MARYTHGWRSSNVTTALANFEVRSGSAKRLKVWEIGIFLAAATASTFGLGRPAAIGVTPTSPVTIVPEDPGEPAASAQTALAWATGPTAPTSSIYLRRIQLPATIGAGVIWTWANGLLVPVSSSLVIFNLSATGVYDGYIVLDE